MITFIWSLHSNDIAMKFTEIQIAILIELSDQKGHSNRELSDSLKKIKNNLVDPLNKLEEKGIICKGERRITTNPAARGKKYHEIPYYINLYNSLNDHLDKEIFLTIIKYLLDKDDYDSLGEFFASKYVAQMIENREIIWIYKNIKDYLGIRQFRDVVSSKLYSSECVRKYYENYSKYIGDNLNLEGKRIDFKIFPKNASLLPFEIVKDFNPIDIIEFYRDNISSEFDRMYRGATADSVVPDSMREFNTSDIYLSPFTSYPHNDPYYLLFAQPFERLYNDVYIIDYEDRELVVERAYNTYVNFAELLFFYMAYLRLPVAIKEGSYIKEQLDQTIRAFMFYWNIAISRLDSLIDTLNRAEEYENGSGVYHIQSGVAGLQVFDLQNNKPLLEPYDSMEILSHESLDRLILYYEEQDAFNFIYPTSYFKEYLGADLELVSGDNILNAIELKIENYNIGF